MTRRNQEEIIALTQRVWSKHLGREVNEDEAGKILLAFQELFSLLGEIRADKFCWDFNKDVVIDPPKRKR
jgi:hypothetical protein